MIDDDYIIHTFFNYNPNRKNLLIKRKRLKEVSNEELEYLQNRFNDSESLNETLKRIYWHIEEKPKCPVCGKPLKFIGMPSCMFPTYCSNECRSKSEEVKKKIIATSMKRYGVPNGGGSKHALEKIRNTCKEKYGVEWTGQIPSQIQHIKDTCIERYGVTNPNKLKWVKDKIVNTCLDKYGVRNGGCSKEALEKIKNTCLERYGTTSAFNVPEIKEKIKLVNIKKYGYSVPAKNKFVRLKIKYILSLPEVKRKQYESKKRNHSYGPHSKEENEAYLYLSLEYPDTIRLYRDEERYPYNCDFYIPCLDLFIEYQRYYTHGGHPFNIHNENDLEKLCDWKLKYLSYYKKTNKWPDPIKTWVYKDPEKRKCAKEHNLNYLEFFNLDELKNWLRGE